MPQDDYYGDGSQEAASPSGGETEKPSDQKTALINASICPGLRPGDTLQLRVVQAHGQEYQVAYDDSGSESESEDQGEGSGSGGMGEEAAMGQGNGATDGGGMY